MSNKIVVEDFTKPPDRSEIVKALAESLFVTATHGGVVVGVGYREVTEALIMCAEFTMQYAKALEVVKDADIRAFRKGAIAHVKERMKILKESGFVDMVKNASKEIAVAAEGMAEAEKEKEPGNES